ncbi:hypothetical protein BDQ17DRAFT_619831 [Cyathus striatus]|nr:hypothetical protein BDQ17DRAFT_619831 [Cyathus striatus]
MSLSRLTGTFRWSKQTFFSLFTIRLTLPILTHGDNCNESHPRIRHDEQDGFVLHIEFLCLTARTSGVPSVAWLKATPGSCKAYAFTLNLRRAQIYIQRQLRLLLQRCYDACEED